VEAHVAAAACNLVGAAERAAALKVDLGPVRLDLVAVARPALAIDPALVVLAGEEGRLARASTSRAIAPPGAAQGPVRPSAQAPLR